MKLRTDYRVAEATLETDMAVNMAKAGCQYITVLCADFMSQNLHAVLDHAGFGKDETCIVHDLFEQEV
ncbi:hypothetical protein AAC387_Pa12g0920 [Persea americana]